MVRWRAARLRLVLVACLAVVAAGTARTASAWHGHGHWHGGGWGYRPGFAFGGGPVGFGGWGWYGGSRFFGAQSVYLGGPFGGFFSGGIRSTVIGMPGWWGGLGYPAFGYSCTYAPLGWGYGGWGYGGWPAYGCIPYAPVVVSPFPGAFGPVYGPAGIRPFLGVSATPPARFAAGLAATDRPGPRAVAERDRAEPPVAAPPARIARASNGEARLRAAKLVATGDRHLREAAADRVKLRAALDAYRRAADAAPDQADTYLRQAIVLVAQGRNDVADKAVARAVALDARLGVDAAAAGAARRALPPDPVFGERPDAGPDSLAARSRGILGRIFRDEGAPRAAAEANWIAMAWLDRVDAGAAALRAVAAR